MTRKTTATLLMGVISIITLFHLLILFKIISYQITWGGKLHNDREMYLFDTVSIVINLFFGLVVLMKGRLIKFTFKEKIVNVILWAFFFLFVFNTVGNLFAETVLEKSLSLITLVFVVLIYRILKAKE